MPEHEAEMSNVAPPSSNSTRRSPANTASPGLTYQTLKISVGQSSSGTTIGFHSPLAPCGRGAGGEGFGSRMDHLVGVITGAYERSAGDFLEAQRPRQHRQL